MLNRVQKSVWTFPVTAGLLAFAWAAFAWVSVIPNQDILVDGIQAQSFWRDPQFFLAFPGQKHGGPLEYPFTLIAERLWPGNYFANAAVRPLFAFATGFTAALLFRRLFPKAPRWAFLLSVAFGPAILSGIMGPASNPFGVIWLQPNYDLAWLFVISGGLLLTATLQTLDSAPRRSGLRRGDALAALVAGLLIGLGFWAHPVFILLIVPLFVLILLRVPWHCRVGPFLVLGGLLGVSPAVISYFVNADVNTWDPSHGAFIAVDYYIAKGGDVLGLNGIPDYINALLPWAWGWAPTDGVSLAGVQSASMWIVVTLVITISVAGTWRAVVARRRPSILTALALTWLAAIVALFGFITFVSPVWLYAVNFAFLFWFTVGAAPLFFAIRVWGAVVASTLLVIEGASMIIHNADYLSRLPAGFREKVSTMEDNIDVARELQARGVDIIFGSYYDAVPIGYASGRELRTVTSRYNRFPLSETELSADSVVVAVNSAPVEPWGTESIQLIASQCTVIEEVAVKRDSRFLIAECDPRVLDIRR